MNNLIKRISLTFALVLGLLTLTQASDFDKENDSYITLSAELGESNEPSLSWETSLEANYFKVYRATVDESSETSADLEFVEVGVSESNSFVDTNILPIESTDNASTYAYYVTAIDAYDAEIGKSESVELNLKTPSEIETPVETDGLDQ